MSDTAQCPAIASPIKYLIASSQVLPAYSGRLYEYILAGNGLWKRAMGRHVAGMVQDQRFTVPGLAHLSPVAALPAGRLPLSFLMSMLHDARQASRHAPVERMWQVVITRDGPRIWRPAQSGQASQLQYAGDPPGDVVAEVHSHHEMDAFFSDTDDRDETAFRFYAVLGHIFTHPVVRVRLGVYGTFWECPAERLFVSTGPVRDVYGVPHAGYKRGQIQ